MVRKGKRILFATLLVYALLVATHHGEFWPFSVYPMFSSAGQPWTRALVREIPPGTAVDWHDKQKAELPGRVFAMNRVGINQNDLANFISKNEEWSADQIAGLRKYFDDKLEQHNLMIYKVRGALTGRDEDSVRVTYIPFILLRSDTTIFKPQRSE